MLCGDSFIVCLDRKGKARASVNQECNISGHTWGLGKYVHPPDMGLVRLLINRTKSTPHTLSPPPPFAVPTLENSSSFRRSHETSLHKKTSRSASYLFGFSHSLQLRVFGRWVDDCLCSRRWLRVQRRWREFAVMILG